MSNFKEKLSHFMEGRYGQDQLYYATLTISFALLILNIFFHSVIIGTLIWIMLFYMTFRAFSRNFYKRQRENQRFLKVWNPIKAKCSLTLRRLREIKTHRFRKCRHCKAVLRLPRRRGKHTVRCPRCNNEFDVRVLF